MTTIQQALEKAGFRVPSEKEMQARYLGADDKSDAFPLLAQGNYFDRVFSVPDVDLDQIT